MDHHDHVRLLRDGIETPGGAWADFGAGSGAFTLALADLLGPGGEIYAVDKDVHALSRNEAAMRSRFPETDIHYLAADFARKVELPALDGVVMANALHFQRDQPTVVELLRGYLRPGGRMLIVEYNIERGNFAAPHPAPYHRWETLAREAGFGHTKLLARRPSRFLHEIYSALSI
jgi:ubiquinone/menaquinone biosynthesis C-methylase UbiE